MLLLKGKNSVQYFVIKVNYLTHLCQHAPVGQVQLLHHQWITLNCCIRQNASPVGHTQLFHQMMYSTDGLLQIVWTPLISCGVIC